MVFQSGWGLSTLQPSRKMHPNPCVLFFEYPFESILFQRGWSSKQSGGKYYRKFIPGYIWFGYNYYMGM
jgi:hypothetical protein